MVRLVATPPYSTHELTYFPSDDLKMIPGQGMPSQRHHEPGDLFIKFTVKFPDHIDPESIPLLERVLPPRTPLQTFPKNIILEEVEMENVDARQRERATGGDPMDEDEGEPRVQCANQ